MITLGFFQISVAVPDLKSRVFQSDCTGEKFFQRGTRIDTSKEGGSTSSNSFVVISRNFKQWEAYNNKDTFLEFLPSQLKSLQFFQPKYTPDQLTYFAANDKSLPSLPPSQCVSPQVRRLLTQKFCSRLCLLSGSNLTAQFFC